MQQRFLYVTAASSIAMMSAAVHGQTFQSTGTDFSPAGVNGQVVTNAHSDATGVDTANVRVSAYAFNADPEDPNFTQDPGFNAPANSGLPAGSTLSFSVLDSLKFWNGVGPVNLGATANRETLQYAFGSASITLSSTSGPQPGLISARSAAMVPCTNI